MTEVKSPAQLNFIVGEPGTGKSTRLVQDALNLVRKGISTTVITPTHSAKKNILSMISKRLEATNEPEEASALKKIRHEVHVLTDSYSGQQAILIDEISMIDSVTLYSLLYQTLNVKNVLINSYGDIKQIPAIKGNSVIEQVLRTNLKDQSLWEWVNDAYENVDFVKLTPPKNWYLKQDIGFEILSTNYRLAGGGYSGYNTQYLIDVIDNSIDHSLTGSGYQEAVLQYLDKGYLFIAPTHERGKEINQYVADKYGDEYITRVPFLTQDKKVYLNPRARDYSLNKERFDFVNDIPAGGNIVNYIPTAYVVVNVAQGATVDNVVYYFGDTPIPNIRNDFYTRNQVYTAVTRSRYPAIIMGDRAEVRKQLYNVPRSAQSRLEYKVADATLKELFIKLQSEELDSPLTFDEIKGRYTNLFKAEAEYADTHDTDILVYNIKSNPRSDKDIKLSFKEYEVGDNGIDYKKLVYESYISEQRAIAAKRVKGRVQKWVSSLSEEDLNKVKDDIKNFSMRQFKAKYDKDLRSVRTAIEKLTTP